MHLKLFCLTVVVLVKFAFSKIAPDYIVPCPTLNTECLTSTAQRVIPELAKGVPSLGIPTLDPMSYALKIDLPGGLKIDFRNGTVTGIRKCVVDYIKYKNNEAELKLHCDTRVKGQYKATGRILLFSLNGDGDVDIRTPNIIVDAKVRFEDKVKNGKTYHEIKDIKIMHKFGEKVGFNITNLLKGSPELSETILTFLNENWTTVTEEFGSPIVDSVLKTLFKHIKKIFSRIPKEELFRE